MIRKNNYLIPLFLVFTLLLPACGGKEAAATMHLVRTEGAVSVNDTDGAPVTLMENLGLYSGYGVATQAESYGWIDLDEAKLAKMDEDSEVEIVKSDKLLEIRVQSGGLFFNVTEPLAEDETMNIRTSTMLVGIRGTCGWVYVEDDHLMRVYLLRGKVECSVLGQDDNALASEMLTAGQMASMTLSGDTASIVIEDFRQEDVPAFVMAEIEEDAAMMESLQPEEPEEPEVTEPPEAAPEEEAPAPEEDEASPEEDSNPADEDEEPAEEDTDAGDEEPTTPEPEEPAPADGDAAPAPEEPTPAVEEPTPETEEPAPEEQPSNADILAQYKEILAQGESYTYKSDADQHMNGGYADLISYKYALYQESGYSVPTLILRNSGVDRNGYLLFRYDPDTGTTSQVGSDTITRFEMPSHSFINDVGWDNWHDLTDTSYLETSLS